MDFDSNQYNNNNSKIRTKSNENFSIKNENSIITTENSIAIQEKQNTAALPPINKKKSGVKKSEEALTSQKYLRVSITEDSNSPLMTETTIELGKSEQKSLKKKSSRDLFVSDMEGRKRSEKTKRSKRKTKSQHEPTARRGPVVDSENNNLKESFTLPQIDEPDLSRRQRRISVDQTNTEEKSLAKKFAYQKENSQSLEVLKCAKERSSSAQSSIYDKASPRFIETNKDKNERKEALNSLRSPSSEHLFTLSQPPINCCAHCQERENKIKRDYDRMILFSKKDRVSRVY